MSSEGRTDAGARSPAYIPTLDGWRCIAIAGVIFYHGTPNDSWLHMFSPYGSRGVNVFFGLSGFLICTKLLEERSLTGAIDLTAFYIRRAFRILPPALVYIAVILLLSLVGLLNRISALEWLSSVFFFRNYLPTSAGNSHYTGHFWSLSVEEHFYLLFPAMLAMAKPRPMLRLLPILVAAVVAWRFLDSRYDIVASFLITEAPYQRTDRCIDGLLCGCIAALAYASPFWRPWIVRFLTTRVFVCAVIAYLVVFATAPPFAALLESSLVPVMILGTVLNTGNVFSRFLELAPIRWVGRLSYSLYIWQTIFFVGAFRAPEGLQLFPVNVVAASLCAVASYYAIEKPCIRAGRQLLKRREARRRREKPD